MELVDEFNLFSSNDLSALDRTINRKSLSSGQLQKVSFMRTMVAETDFLLLDESTSKFDDHSREQIFSILKIRKLQL